jgi:hypothetical protein
MNQGEDDALDPKSIGFIGLSDRECGILMREISPFGDSAKSSFPIPLREFNGNLPSPDDDDRKVERWLIKLVASYTR